MDTVTALDPTAARNFLRNVLKLASIGAMFTPNTTDNLIVTFLQNSLENDDVWNVVVSLFNMMDKGKNVSTEMLIEALKKNGHLAPVTVTLHPTT